MKEFQRDLSADAFTFGVGHLEALERGQVFADGRAPAAGYRGPGSAASRGNPRSLQERGLARAARRPTASQPQRAGITKPTPVLGR